jgi:small subunit ribosomal protein S6
MNNYEAMIVLDTKGKEESVEQLVSAVTQELEKAGAKLEQIDHLGKRKFPFNPRHVEAGYFVNILFKAAATSLDAARSKIRLNDNVYQQYYQRRA